jgi:two-component system NtrC family response regulator
MADKESILVVDDDLNTLKMVEQFLLIKKYNVTTCLTSRDAIRELGKGSYSAAVIDYFMPDTTGLEMMKAFHKIDPELPVLILTASRDIKIAVETIKEGAFHYLVKPVDPDELYVNLDKAFKNRSLVLENQRLKLDLQDRYKFDHIIGDSGRMVEVFDMTLRAAKVRSTVLIIGETGSGKELIARAVHFNSDRAQGPFIGVNCSALPESLLEAELFGIEKNVATGVDARTGKFEAANDGTLFLDEIGDMAPSTQSKVLRAMQEREIERVGSHTSRKIDIRIVAATNRDLTKAIEEKEFREDLFYRLNVLMIALPSLRDRTDDIPKLIEHFLKKYCDENKMKLKGIDQDAANRLMTYHWPGNVRELENSIERAVVMCDDESIGVRHLPPYILDNHGAAPDQMVIEGEDGGALEDMVNSYERGLILSSLEKNDWKQNRAADDMGISERSMWYKIKKLGIEVKKGAKSG